MNKLKYKLPLIPLRGITIFPGMVLHFDIGRPKSISAIEAALNCDKLVFLCYQTDISVVNPTDDDLAKVGTICEIKQTLRLPDGNIRVLVEGLDRAVPVKFTQGKEYIEATVSLTNSTECEDKLHEQVLIRKLQHLIEKYLELYDKLTPEAITALLTIEDSGELADVVAMNLPIKPQLKQSILEEFDIQTRLERLISIIENELDILSIEQEFEGKVEKNISQNQREYYLREKLRVIHEELGDSGDTEQLIEKYKEALIAQEAPDYVTRKVGEECERLIKTPPLSQEYAVIQNYIETVIALPWGKMTEETLDIQKASDILNRDHYGLEKVKERILEYIAVKKLAGKESGAILCLVGPPGTGKTSIARSLAEALGRNYVRISLGGVQNESEIRGHRKTYVGAMPGRIIDGIKRAGSSNPLILFDEIDKMSRDYSGDPASAMLEVFDPEQNKTFRDHFLELDYDLSNVLCIATANSLEGVAKPLIDRMDIIEISGYTESEKMYIAKKYLIPKQRTKHGLKSSLLKMTDSAIEAIIRYYTRESGVRELERKISAICRKSAKLLVEKNKKSISISQKNIEKFLGKKIYLPEKLDKADKIGTVNGLAYTEYGGDALQIEVCHMPGSGKIEITGNLGKIMEESACAAFTYVRSNAERFGINPDFYKKTDIHVHVPEGAVPKDGPSAGITIATAMISALSNRYVKSDVAMTGEITLRGNVLPIGGLKEKTLAAYRMGLKTVIVPHENQADYDELPDIVKDNIKFVFAKTMTDVLNVAISSNIPPKKSADTLHFFKSFDGPIDSPPNDTVQTH